MNNPVHDQKIKRFALLDALLICMLLALAVLFFPAMKSATPAVVHIRRDRTLLARYPLTDDRTIQIQGENGPLTVTIRKRSVAVTYASCKNQVCVRTGSIGRPPQQIICAPNHVVVEIAGKEQDSLDGIAR